MGFPYDANPAIWKFGPPFQTFNKPNGSKLSIQNAMPVCITEIVPFRRILPGFPGKWTDLDIFQVNVSENLITT